MKIKLKEIQTTATTFLRGKIKIFQLIEQGTPLQRLELWEKIGIFEFHYLELEKFLHNGERKKALKMFLKII